MKCCICGKYIRGYGNNPHGHLDDEGGIIEYEPSQRCCDDCNRLYVIPGRMLLVAKTSRSRGGN